MGETIPLLGGGQGESQPLLGGGQGETQSLLGGGVVVTQPLLGGGQGEIQEDKGKGVGTRGKGRKSKGGRDVTAPDPELVNTATKFVQDIIAKAKLEAAFKLKDEKMVSIDFFN